MRPKIIDQYTNLPVSKQRKWSLRHPEKNKIIRQRYKRNNKAQYMKGYKQGRRKTIEEVLRLRRFEYTDMGMRLDLSRKSPWINAEDIDALAPKEGKGGE